MNIFFDCDYTIIAMNGSLRPGVRELFQRLKDDGHTIYVWSGMGIRWRDVRKHRLEPYVTDCFLKPLFDYQRRMKSLGVTVAPDMVIDDYPDIVSVLGGIRVKAYLYEKSSDTEMERLYPIISALIAQDGHSSNSSPAPL
ncbi:MAG: HAD family hydrolase [Chloroflexi bacterium]|nr:HAD family hydrolase [Chloroflexota bacterium]